MRRIVSISALAILLAVTLAVPASASTQTDDAISPELRAALKAPLTTRIKELLKEKDDLGSSYIYGSYYDSFTLPTGGEAGGLASGTEAYYSFDYANVHFVCLDSQDTDRRTGSTTPS